MLDTNFRYMSQMTDKKWNKKGWVWVWRLLASELHRHWHPIIEQALDWESSEEHPSELCHGTRQNKEKEGGMEPYQKD